MRRQRQGPGSPRHLSTRRPEAGRRPVVNFLDLTPAPVGLSDVFFGAASRREEENLMSLADVVVVGGGHNGLACAAYLAKAGRRVVVVESQGVLGGLSSTEATVKEAPGFLMNTGALDMVFSNRDQ